MSMKCDSCEEKATVFYTQIAEGKLKKFVLCESCAQEKGGGKSFRVEGRSRLSARCSGRSPGGLEEDGVEVLSAGGEGVEGADQVPAHGAANTSVVHAHNVLLGLDLRREEGPQVVKKKRTRQSPERGYGPIFTACAFPTFYCLHPTPLF